MLISGPGWVPGRLHRVVLADTALTIRPTLIIWRLRAPRVPGCMNSPYRCFTSSADQERIGYGSSWA
jgi:hypothetical protein